MHGSPGSPEARNASDLPLPSASPIRILIGASAIRNRRSSLKTQVRRVSNRSFLRHLFTPSFLFARQLGISNRHFARLENTSKSMKTNAHRDF